jgi:hypothetical protein
MARLGWSFIIVGLVIGAVCCILAATAGRSIDSAVFLAAGLAGLIVTAVGIVYLNRARGRWAPPI